MPLATAVLKTALINAFTANLPGITPDQATALDTTCGAVANALEAYVKTATITYTAGLVAPGGGGPVTGVFTNTIT